MTVHPERAAPGHDDLLQPAARRGARPGDGGIAALKQGLGVPATIMTHFAGTAQIFQDALANQGLLLTAAVLSIYVVLGMLYESFIHPLTILTGLPAAALGALLTLWLFGLDLSSSR